MSRDPEMTVTLDYSPIWLFRGRIRNVPFIPTVRGVVTSSFWWAGATLMALIIAPHLPIVGALFSWIGWQWKLVAALAVGFAAGRYKPGGRFLQQWLLDVLRSRLRGRSLVNGRSKKLGAREVMGRVVSVGPVRTRFRTDGVLRTAGREGFVAFRTPVKVCREGNTATVSKDVLGEPQRVDFSELDRVTLC